MIKNKSSSVSPFATMQSSCSYMIESNDTISLETKFSGATTLSLTSLKKNCRCLIWSFKTDLTSWILILGGIIFQKGNSFLNESLVEYRIVSSIKTAASS